MNAIRAAAKSGDLAGVNPGGTLIQPADELVDVQAFRLAFDQMFAPADQLKAGRQRRGNLLADQGDRFASGSTVLPRLSSL